MKPNCILAGILGAAAIAAAVIGHAQRESHVYSVAIYTSGVAYWPDWRIGPSSWNIGFQQITYGWLNEVPKTIRTNIHFGKHSIEVPYSAEQVGAGLMAGGGALVLVIGAGIFLMVSRARGDPQSGPLGC